jgi:hypothetical protein
MQRQAVTMFSAVMSIQQYKLQMQSALLHATFVMPCGIMLGSLVAVTQSMSSKKNQGAKPDAHMEFKQSSIGQVETAHYNKQKSSVQKQATHDPKATACKWSNSIQTSTVATERPA